MMQMWHWFGFLLVLVSLLEIHNNSEARRILIIAICVGQKIFDTRVGDFYCNMMTVHKLCIGSYCFFEAKQYYKALKEMLLSPVFRNVNLLPGFR